MAAQKLSCLGKPLQTWPQSILPPTRKMESRDCLEGESCCPVTCLNSSAINLDWDESTSAPKLCLRHTGRVLENLFEQGVDATWLSDSRTAMLVDCKRAAVELICVAQASIAAHATICETHGIACWCEPWLSVLLFLKD